jgi:hypothetical protein
MVTVVNSTFAKSAGLAVYDSAGDCGTGAATVAHSTGDQSSDAHRVIGRRVMLHSGRDRPSSGCELVRPHTEAHHGRQLIRKISAKKLSKTTRAAILFAHARIVSYRVLYHNPRVEADVLIP